MPQSFSQSELLRLAETPSTADHMTVYQWLGIICTVPVRYDEPGDDANFIAELHVGESGDPRMLIVTFSCFGNLCYIYPVQKPYLSTHLMEFILHLHGWTLLSELTAGKILYSKGDQCVADFFFNYI